MSTNPLTELLRPHAPAIATDAVAGDVRAQQVISFYQMYVACPGDMAAYTFCEVAFEAWQKHRRIDEKTG